MSTDQYETGGGIRIRRTVDDIPVPNAIEPLIAALDTQRGGLLASNYEYPGRYTRWELSPKVKEYQDRFGAMRQREVEQARRRAAAAVE